MSPRPHLCLLPGLMCDASIWAHQSEALTQDYDIQIPDFSACASIVEMAERVLDTAPETFSVAGHSMGARVAIEVIRLAPERVERLALLDTGVHTRQPGETARRQVLIDVALNQGLSALADAWLPMMVNASRVEDAELMEPLRAMVLRLSPQIYERQVKALLGRPDAAVGLSRVTCPTLVAVGRQDVWSPPEQHEVIVAAIPHARYVIFEECGHMSPVEAPDAVTAALADWMSMPVQGVEPEQTGEAV